MASSNEIIIFTAINDTDLAEEFITNMLEAGLIISGTIFPGTTLMYRWENKINLDEEVKIIIKAKRENYDKIEDYIMHRHPYKMPEMTCIDATFGSERFREFCRNKP
ncbi:MAG: divalent-cation tolerance protein CutA [Spirochaetes bacterium]|nr:divalent-cation tolerance protein CutA [Spirochaetota bacterium]